MLVGDVTLGTMTAPTRRTALYVFLVTVVIILVAIVGSRAVNRYDVATMLNIETLPPSVSNIDCASFGFTDVLERCAFQIAPADVEALLAGYRYTEASACRAGGPVGLPCVDANVRVLRSHTYCCGPKVGPDFAVAHTFIASPEEFEHGGSVTVLVDRTRSYAMVDLYIE